MDATGDGGGVVVAAVLIHKSPSLYLFKKRGTNLLKMFTVNTLCAESPISLAYSCRLSTEHESHKYWFYTHSLCAS